MGCITEMDEDRMARAVADLSAGVAVERALAATGRCLCGRGPTLRDRWREAVLRFLL